MDYGLCRIDEERYLSTLLEGDWDQTPRGLVLLIDVDECDHMLVALVRPATGFVLGHSGEWGE